MHPLDNPIWTSLGTAHARFAAGEGPARRFPAEVSPLVGIETPTPEAFAALEALVAPGETVGVFLDESPSPMKSWTVAREGDLLQMVHDGRPFDKPDRKLVRLGAQDSADMLALTKTTNPGPFGPRTHELGSYFGVREGGKLVAMAGERLRLPGWTEISAVCTHPCALGRGFAGECMSAVGEGIRARGETAFLHVLPQNERAISLYKRLGFARRRLSRFALLTRRSSD